MSEEDSGGSRRAGKTLAAGAAAERARCLAITTDVLARGPGFPCSPEFADGYSNAAQQIAVEIAGGAVPITANVMCDGIRTWPIKGRE